MAQIIVPILISAALSALSYLLLKKPSGKNPFKGEHLATVASRGSFIPVILGRRRTGTTVGWVGCHYTKREKSSGGGGKGSGGKSGKKTVNYEEGWHILCVGPAYALHRILCQGKTFWQGPIYRATTPSGSTVSAGRKGTFKIYWGEHDQPINTSLGQSKRVGINSRWPYLCYIVWNDYRLGAQRSWPVLDYEIEVRPEFSTLTQSDNWMEAANPELQEDEAEDVWKIKGSGAGWPPLVPHSIYIRGYHLRKFFAGQTIRLKDNDQNSDGDRIIDVVSYDKDKKATVITTTTNLNDDLPTWNFGKYKPDGILIPYFLSENDGANPAHVLDQLLFEEYPHGLGFRDQIDTPFNSNSLEALGVLTSRTEEEFLCSMKIEEGEDARGSIAGLLQDLGVLLRFNIKTALFEVLSVRTPVLSAIPHAEDGMLLPPAPEIATLIGDRPRDKLVFKFLDRNNNYRTNCIVRDDDSASSLRGHVKTIDIQLPNVINHATAVTVVERRAQEEHGNMAAVSLRVNREGRALLPGDVLTINDVSSVLRVLEKQIDTLSSKTTIDAVIDFYGVEQSDFEDEKAGGPKPLDDEVGGDIFDFIEVPAYINREQEINIVVPRLRTDDQVTQSTIHISRDGSTYTVVGIESFHAAGGQLADDIAITDDAIWENGPQFLALGPDVDTIQDLSGDDLNWRMGRQLLIIDEEIFFLRNITAMGDDFYRLDGLVRGRYDTLRAAHAAGTYIYIISMADLLAIGDILLVAGKTLYVKSQPETVEAISLDLVEPVSKTLIGKGVGPVIPANLRTQNMRNDYATGQAIPLWWAYRSTAIPKTGAGLQGAGEAHSPSPVQGEFILRIYDSTGVTLKRTVNDIGTDLEWTYTNIKLLSDFGSEPSSFVVRLTNVVANLESGIVETTIVKV